MSKYEDYSEVSKVYDKERTAMGADTIAGLLHVYGGKPLKDLHVLDAGCGTGNYAKALIEFGVGKITLLDASKDMLDVAKEKLKTEIEKGIVDQVIEAKMPPLPFEDGKFDVVLFSLVLHHIDDTGNGVDFPILEDVFHEAKRSLSSRGIMVLLTCLPTVIHSAWYAKLQEDLHNRHAKLYPTIKQYIGIFSRCGFEMRTKLNILGVDIWKDYYDAEGPLKASWSKGDSIFRFASEDEIRNIEVSVRRMKENGTLEVYMRKQDKAMEVGLITLILCVAQ